MNEYELHHLAVLNRIATALETIALTNAPAPNFVKPIEMYSAFDFTSIGATVKQYDTNGPTELEWGGYLWTRRSPQNKFGEAIWFSRATGKDAEGNVKYSRLITFRKMGEAEPLPRKVEKMIEQPDPVTYPTKPETTTVSTTPKSELDQHFGPRATDQKWQTTETEFNAWTKERKINGTETRSALGTDAKTWMRMNGKGWSDVAQTIAATLAK